MPKRAPGGSDVNPAYSFKPSLMAPAFRFELTDQGLSWRMGARAGLWPYAGIARIRLSYRPTAMQARRYRADVRNGDGRSITLFSATWQAATLLAPQDDPYRRFVIELHRRIAAAEGSPELVGGLTRPAHAAGLVATGLVYAALAGLLVRAVAVASAGGLLFLMGFGALFGWKVGGALHRNRPRAYRLDDPPAELLP